MAVIVLCTLSMNDCFSLESGACRPMREKQGLQTDLTHCLKVLAL